MPPKEHPETTVRFVSTSFGHEAKSSQPRRLHLPPPVIERRQGLHGFPESLP
jgi:hypothetical protein